MKTISLTIEEWTALQVAIEAMVKYQKCYTLLDLEFVKHLQTVHQKIEEARA